MGFTVNIDRQRCISAGRCMATAPAAFDQDADGMAFVLADGVKDTADGLIREAQFLCPAQAIELASDDLSGL